MQPRTYSVLTLHFIASGHPAVCSEYRRHGNCDCLFSVWIVYLLQHVADAANSREERCIKAARKGGEEQNCDSKEEVQ